MSRQSDRTAKRSSRRRSRHRVLSSAGWAQGAWPTKPIRIVVPFNPGGAIDALVRVIADGLTAKLGQQVLVDPKPGANTIVGSEIVAKAAPDGYTFLITTNSTHTNNPSLYAKLPFDPAKDLIPVSLVSLGTILRRGEGRRAVQRPARHGQVGEGAGPARHLRQLGHRLERPSLRPDVRAGAGRPLQPRALSRRRAGHPGRGQRHARHHLGEPDQRQAADRRRPRQAAGRRGLQALGLDAASCRPSPSSSSPASTSACSSRPMRRPARRPRSSTACRARSKP